MIRFEAKVSGASIIILKNGKSGTFYVINYTSKYVTLVQLIDKHGNVRHDVIIYGVCIYDTNNNKVLPLVKNHWILSVQNQLMTTLPNNLSKYIIQSCIPTQKPKRFINNNLYIINVCFQDKTMRRQMLQQQQI